MIDLDLQAFTLYAKLYADGVNSLSQLDDVRKAADDSEVSVDDMIDIIQCYHNEGWKLVDAREQLRSTGITQCITLASAIDDVINGFVVCLLALLDEVEIYVDVEDEDEIADMRRRLGNLRRGSQED